MDAWVSGLNHNFAKVTYSIKGYRPFDSDSIRHATIAQLVEQSPCKRKVGSGSIPPCGSILD